MQKEINDINFAPFYAGQKVVAVDAMEGATFKNGQNYVVSKVEYKLGNPSHPIGRVTYYWYVGIVGFSNGGAYYRPTIFAPIEEKFETITLEKVLEQELYLISSN